MCEQLFSFSPLVDRGAPPRRLAAPAARAGDSVPDRAQGCAQCASGTSNQQVLIRELFRQMKTYRESVIAGRRGLSGDGLMTRRSGHKNAGATWERSRLVWPGNRDFREGLYHSHARNIKTRGYPMDWAAEREEVPKSGLCRRRRGGPLWPPTWASDRGRRHADGYVARAEAQRAQRFDVLFFSAFTARVILTAVACGEAHAARSAARRQGHARSSGTASGCTVPRPGAGYDLTERCRHVKGRRIWSGTNTPSSPSNTRIHRVHRLLGSVGRTAEEPCSQRRPLVPLVFQFVRKYFLNW